jgi:hypothetical protein
LRLAGEGREWRECRLPCSKASEPASPLARVTKTTYDFLQMPTPPARSLDARILARLRRRGAGTVFVPSDFVAMGSRNAVDVALHRLVARGEIRRLGRGVYDLPKRHRVLGEITPSADAIASALAGRDRLRLQPSGAYAANLLGLSEQLPAKVVFLTDGATRTVRIGGTTIQLRRTTPRNMATAGRLSGLLIQALRSLGRRHVTPERVAHLKRAVPAKERRRLLKDLRFAPAWMHPIFRDLAGASR